MTFRKRYRWRRRLALALAFASTASPAAAMHTPDEASKPVTTARSRSGGSGWNDVASASGAAAALGGLGGGSVLAIRSRQAPRLLA